MKKTQTLVSFVKKMIINAGIKQVIVRTGKNEYKTISVEEWIKNDELLEGKITY